MLGVKNAVGRTLKTNKGSLMKTACAVVLGAVIMYIFYVKVLKPRINSDYTPNKEFVNKRDVKSDTVNLMYFLYNMVPIL